MGVAMIAPHEHLGGIRITVSKQGRNLVRPVDSGAVSRDVDRPPPRQGCGDQQPVGRPHPFVCVSVPQWLARLGGPGRARFLYQRHRLCIHGDQRVPGIIGTLRDLQASLPVGHTIGMVLWGHHPALVSGWLAEVFLSVYRTVAEARVSTTGSATRGSASNVKVHWAWPAGGGAHR